jgi:tetratricopeptide (TPR) repeat protein
LEQAGTTEAPPAASGGEGRPAAPPAAPETATGAAPPPGDVVLSAGDHAGRTALPATHASGAAPTPRREAAPPAKPAPRRRLRLRAWQRRLLFGFLAAVVLIALVVRVTGIDADLVALWHGSPVLSVDEFSVPTGLAAEGVTPAIIAEDVHEAISQINQSSSTMVGRPDVGASNAGEPSVEIQLAPVKFDLASVASFLRASLEDHVTGTVVVYRGEVVAQIHYSPHDPQIYAPCRTTGYAKLAKGLLPAVADAIDSATIQFMRERYPYTTAAYYYEQHDTTDATKDCLRCIQFGFDTPTGGQQELAEGYSLWGMIERDAGDYGDAESNLNRAIGYAGLAHLPTARMEQNLGDLYNDEAGSASGAGAASLYREAVSWYQKALSDFQRINDPHDTAVVAGDTGTLLALEAQSDAGPDRSALYQSADGYFAQSDQGNPTDPQMLSNWGDTDLDEGALDAARTHYQQSLELDPSFENSLAGLGRVDLDQAAQETGAARTADLADARRRGLAGIRARDAAFASISDKSYCYLTYGQALQASGMTAAAASAYRTAESVSTNASDRQAAAQALASLKQPSRPA